MDFRSKYLNEGNSLKRTQAGGDAPPGKSAATSTSPFAQNDKKETPEGRPSEDPPPLEQTSSSVRNMEKVVSMWQDLQLVIPGAGSEGENVEGVQETNGAALDPKNVQDSSGGGHEAATEPSGACRARRMNKSSTFNTSGGVSMTRQRSGGGGDGSDNTMSISASLAKPSDSYKEVHPHSQVLFKHWSQPFLQISD